MPTLSEIRERNEKRTQGEWTNDAVFDQAHETEICAPSSPESGFPNVIATVLGVSECPAKCLRDAQFIAHAPADITALLGWIKEYDRLCADTIAWFGESDGMPEQYRKRLSDLRREMGE